jgi:hypothetical protein
LIFYKFVRIIKSGVRDNKSMGKEMQRVPSSPHEQGQGLVEYALVLVLAAIVIGMMIYLLLPSLLH